MTGKPGTEATTRTTGTTRGDGTDVLVVGAGPTGMLLAGDLAAAGVRVTIIERRPHETSNMTRAFGVHARTLELLDARGLADELVKTGTSITGLRLFSRISSTSPGSTPASRSCSSPRSTRWSVCWSAGRSPRA